jgi:ATP-dependent Clp protease adaptor protein ClpS
VEVLALMLAGVGVALLAHRYQIRRGGGRIDPTQLFDADADVAATVALHEAQRRDENVTALHLLYGLLQDEGFTAAITKLGGDAAKIEDRVSTELDRKRAPDSAEGTLLLARAVNVAKSHQRRATTTDIWSFTSRTHTANLVEVGGITAYALLFALVHGGAKPSLTLAGQERVDVVLRNDDYTTREYVVTLLREVFETPDAEGVMSRTHDSGRAVVGRYPADEAKARVEKAQAHARDNGFPLWIGVEPF